MDRLVFILLLALSAASSVFSQSAITGGVALTATQPAIWQRAASTGNTSLLRWPSGLELPGNSLEEKIQAFLSTYQADIGLKSSASFVLSSDQQDLAGFHHLKMQQLQQGIPVFDGHLTFHFDKKNRLRTISGVLVDDTLTDAVARLTAADAAAIALNWSNNTHPEAVDLLVAKNQLFVYQQGLVEGRKGEPRLAYYLELTNQKSNRDYLLIDAQNGQLIEHFSGICHLLQREVYLSNLNNMIWQEGDIFPSSLDSWQQSEIVHSESVYHLFKNSFQYTSYDNQGAAMRIIDQAGFLDCPNANWNGYSTNYCNSIGTDDVVGHEWGHAYTEYTSNLLLAWQAGAINEAYSDIWGETLDLLNGDADAELLRTDCDNSSRWKIGEAAEILSEPLRDLYQPNCYGDPGKLSDPQYHCSTTDHGGVHTNSLIISHAYALLVDGGTYNGYTIPAIGLTKAAHIFWQTQRLYLSRTSDFKAMANGLEAACHDLRGINLPVLSLDADMVALSGQEIDAADSLALSLVIAATEMRMDMNVCPEYTSALNPNAEDWCNEFGKVFYPFYTENFEGDITGWNVTEWPEAPNSWIAREWQLAGRLPADRPGKAIFGPSPNAGDCDVEVNNGIIRLESPAIVVPTGLEGHVYLTFDHYFSLEKGQDGGNIKIQQDGGGWTKIPPSAFLFNAYNDILQISRFTDNPMAGERVFSGADEGSVSGSWGTTQIDLDIIGVRAGDEIVMRWELGTNGCDGWEGWYIDDIKLGTCAVAPLLPVEWQSFTAKLSSRGAQLNWTTAREQNNAGFSVERSLDGRIFEPIAWINGQGDREVPTDYTFLDTELTPETDYIYYRLRQEDYNGNHSYSPIRELKIDRKIHWRISPNPVSNQLKLDGQGTWSEPMTIHIYNLQGQNLYSQLVLNPFTATINVEQLPAGLYLLRLCGENHESTERFIVE